MSRKEKNKKWALGSLLGCLGIVLIFGVIIIFVFSSDEQKSVSKPSEVEQGLVDREQSKVYSNLSVQSERIIENYENLSDVYAGNDDIEITKVQNVTDNSGNEYANNFRMTGSYDYDGKKYNFSTTISYQEDNFDSAISILFYKSSNSGTLVDVEME